MEIADIQKELAGMAVIVTGGNQGIGEGIAEAFCTYGANVTIAARNETTGREVAERLTRTTAGTCTFRRCEVSDPQQMREMIDETAARCGKLDCIVNNAGIQPLRAPIDEMTWEDMMRAVEVNLGGTFAGCKYAMPYLRASRGSVINISSVLGHAGQEGAALYAATKGAIIAFTKSIACDEARNGVRVNVLNPGDIHTAINDKEKANHMESIGKEHIQWIPRQGTPSEIGTACLFLASSWASFITGSELFVDGGFFAGSGYKHARFDWTEKMRVQTL